MRYSFGPFEISPDSGELRKSGRAVKLAPQPFQLLAFLIEHAGVLVTREELQAALWPDGTTVEFDPGLNYCIRQIRLALGDDAREPLYIETVPKRGYRFFAPVTSVADSPLAEAQTPVPVVLPSRRPWILTAIAASVLLVAAIVLWPKEPNLPRDPRARQLFQEAEYLAGTWETEKVLEATKRYDQVTSIEPDFTPAWAGWTNADIVLAHVGPSAARALADSEVHARKALSLDSSLASAHAALAHSDWQQWKWSQADDEFRQALSGTGDRANAHHLYGVYLASLGRKEEAIQHARLAVELEPTSGLVSYSLALVYLQARDFKAAVDQANKTLLIDRYFPLALQTSVRANIQLGQLDVAAHVLSDALRVYPDSPIRQWQAYLLARSGHTEEARANLEQEKLGNRKYRYPNLGHLAAFIALGDRPGALRAVQAGIDAHVPSMVWLSVAPELDSLRSDPEFIELESRVRKAPLVPHARSTATESRTSTKEHFRADLFY